MSTTFAATQTAIFAGGCFWCMEADFDKVRGVLETISGFDGGTTKSPTYEQVASGNSDYVESVKIKYDPNIVSYRELVEFYLQHINPLDKGGQFCDRGKQYRSVIFYLTEEQKQIASQSLEKLQKKFPKFYTQIAESTKFYKAAEYHQNYYLKNPISYKFYRFRCNRDVKIKEVWENVDF